MWIVVNQSFTFEELKNRCEVPEAESGTKLVTAHGSEAEAKP